MKGLRRILGILVMIAGILGLVLSIAGLVGVWMVKPIIAGYTDSTILTLNTSISTSQSAMQITGQTLNAAVDSVDALSEMLANTAISVEDTQPVITQLNQVIGETLPVTLESAADSLATAGQAASVLDGAIQSLQTFQALLSATPLLGALVQPSQPYNPDIPLSESLTQLAGTLDDLPATFTQMSKDLDKADDNLAAIQTNLTTMSESVGLISESVGEYGAIITQSQTSMEGVNTILTDFQSNLNKYLDGIAIVFSLFFLWLLAAQVVILSQGWELFQGTAGRMEGEPELVIVEDTGKVRTEPPSAG